MTNNESYIERVFNLAQQSLQNGGFPAGALIVLNNKIIGEGMSLSHANNDATMHAEIAAIRATKRYSLKGATLYSSLEPCVMCFSACSWADISHIVYGCRRECVNTAYYEGDTNLDSLNSTWNNMISLSRALHLEQEIAELVKKRDLILKLD